MPNCPCSQNFHVLGVHDLQYTNVGTHSLPRLLTLSISITLGFSDSTIVFGGTLLVLLPLLTSSFYESVTFPIFHCAIYIVLSTSYLLCSSDLF